MQLEKRQVQLAILCMQFHNQSQRKIQLLVQITNDDVKAAAQRLYKKMNEERHEVLICDKSINSSGKKLDIML